RVPLVTGVQTCALPISLNALVAATGAGGTRGLRLFSFVAYSCSLLEEQALSSKDSHQVKKSCHPLPILSILISKSSRRKHRSFQDRKSTRLNSSHEWIS